MNIRRLIGLFLVAAALTVSTAHAHSPSELISKVMGHLGGTKLYESARFVKFTWATERDGKITSERHHTWDRYSGSYVLEFTDREGVGYRTYFNVNTKQGVGFKSGEAVEGEELSKLLDRAYGTYINDTYWLLMPAKLRDPGVHLQFIGHGPSVHAWRRNRENVAALRKLFPGLCRSTK